MNIWTKQINKIDTMISRLRAIIMRTPVGATGLLEDLHAEVSELQDKRIPLILAEMRVRHGCDGQAYNFDGCPFIGGA